MQDCNQNPDEVRIGHLIASIGRLHASRADRFMERFGLHRGQAILLMMLSNHDGMTHTEVAEKLTISPAAATKVIKRLEALNYLQRRADPSDERISRVYLEKEGWAVIHKIKDAFHQIDQILLRNISPEEKESLIQLLRRMYINLLE